MGGYIFSSLNINEVISATLAIFAVIDPLGSIPIYIKYKRKIGGLNVFKVTSFVAIIMLVFLFLGPYILRGFSIELKEFAVAGGLIMLILGLEMVLGIEIFKVDSTNTSNAFLTPVAFPVIVGPGTMTALLTLQADHSIVNIVLALFVNFFILFVVLRHIVWIEKQLTKIGLVGILHKVMGIILLAMAVKLFKLHLFH